VVEFSLHQGDVLPFCYENPNNSWNIQHGVVYVYHFVGTLNFCV